MKITFDFIPLSERFPEKSGQYQALTKNGCIDLHFSLKYLAFNAFDSLDEETTNKTCFNDKVIAWAEIPKELDEWRKGNER